MTNPIRNAVADMLRIDPEALGCFTVVDREDQPMQIIVHGEEGAGIYQEVIVCQEPQVIVFERMQSQP